MKNSFDSHSLSSLILETSKTIYNNIADFKGLKGRATLEIAINPNPLILWDFECVDKTEIEKIKLDFNDFLPPNRIDKIKANRIEILNPICRSLSGKQGDKKDTYSEFRASGYSKEMCIGDISEEINGLHFYIPNFRVHSICREHNIANEDGRWKFGDKSTLIFDVPFLNDWILSFETNNESNKWLENRFNNNGVLITTVGKIWPKKESANKKLPFSWIRKEIEQLFMLLSFANGGYISPIIYNGFIFNTDTERDPSIFIYFISQGEIASVEELGSSWFIRESDLVGFIKCYDEFASLLNNNNWHDPFMLILANYFIAISTRSWQIAASSIGTVIERLAHLVLVEEENNPTEKNTNEKLFNTGQSKLRLTKTLGKIGLTKNRNINDIDHIVDFIGTRNDAVHPKNKILAEKERWENIRYGIQWVEEIILWRIGYSDWYQDRISKNKNDNMPYNAGPGRFVPRYCDDYKKRTT